MDVNKIPIEQALEVLDVHILTIRTVTEWAQYMRYCRGYFSIKFREEYNQPAIEKLIEVKYVYLQKVMKELPAINSRELAERAGFLNPRAVRRFLRNNYNLSLTEFRENAVN